MNYKRKYLKHKKRQVSICKYFKKCYKQCRKSWVKNHYKEYFKEEINTLKEMNDKYYRIRADFRFIKKVLALNNYNHKDYMKSKAYYLRYVKNK